MSPVTTWHPGVILPTSDLTPAMVLAIMTELSPAQTLALTAWREAEARLEHGRWIPNPLDAHVDILNVIHNRASDGRWKKLGHKGVCLQHRQFSCWDDLGGAANFHSLLYTAQQLLAGVQPVGRLLNVLAAAEGCLADALVDTLQGSTHYIASWLNPWPTWAQGHTPVVRRWGHLFFSDIP